MVKLLDSSFHSFINPHHLNPFEICMKYSLSIPFLFGIMLCAISFCFFSRFSFFLSLFLSFSLVLSSLYISFSTFPLFLFSFFLFSLPHRVSEWTLRGFLFAPFFLPCLSLTRFPFFGTFRDQQPTLVTDQMVLVHKFISIRFFFLST